MKKIPFPERALICIGLLLATLPQLFKEYIPIPDFLRGLLAGVGLGMELTGFIMLKKRRRAETNC
jgi:hypothetical protein